MASLLESVRAGHFYEVNISREKDNKYLYKEAVDRQICGIKRKVE
jgi:Cys-tRNA synthase (O-phospho-L-seryl-tRNA:Cys-tRNA synthase)